MIVLCLISAVMLVMACKSPSDSEPDVKSEGTVAIHINGSANMGSRTVTAKLFEKDNNVFDLTETGFDSLTITLNRQGAGTDTFAYAGKGGEIVQIAGLIKAPGNGDKLPDANDYWFHKQGVTIDGITQVTLGESELKAYSTMAGEGSFKETNLDNHHLRIWHADGRTGWTRLGWIGDVDQMVFRFNGSDGAIGRVGRKYSSSRGGPIYVDQIDDSPVNVKAKVNYTGPGTHLFCIYGWVMDGLGWGSSDIKHEFYVIEQLNRKEYDPVIGELEVDGIKYIMHKYDFGGGSYRFKAVRSENPRFTGPINMKPFFEHWRQNGMENYFLDEMTWCIELIGGYSNGYFACWDIEIPDYN